MQFYGISFTIKHILPSTKLLIWMHERNTINVHVQVFLRMNTWMFETCRRHYNILPSTRLLIWMHERNTINTMFRTSKCSSSTRLAHAVLWYFFHDQAHPAINQAAYMDSWKKYHKRSCTSLPEDEHLDVRNMSKTL